MKKSFLFIAAFCMVASVSCTKEVETADDSMIMTSQGIRLNIKVADTPATPGTRAAKTGWVAGDKINIWFDDLDVMSLIGDNKGRAELTLTYDGNDWTGEFDEFYSKDPSGLFYTLNSEGVLNCLYEGSDSIEDYYVYIENYDYTFYSKKNGDDAPITPLMCWADSVVYSYDEAAKTIEAEISGWTMLTKVQVVVAGLNSADASKYTLSCNNLNIFPGVSINSETGDVYCVDYDYDVPTAGVSNTDGVAFCFYDVVEYPELEYEFTLSYGTDTWFYNAGEKDLVTSDKAVQFIKIDSSKFE